MISIEHPLSDELLGLVEMETPRGPQPHKERDTSWRWMGIALAVIGLVAWLTR